MFRWGLNAIGRTVRGITVAIRARPKVFGGVALGVFVLNLFLPVAVLSLARKPVDYFTFNPWLSRLPEYLSSGKDSVGRKVEFLSNMALAWFISENPIEGVEWGFIIDVPSLAYFLITSLLFGAYFALWFYRRDRAQRTGWGASAARSGGVAGALTSVLGFTTGACSVMGCGLPVLPVVALALTGLSSGTLAFFSELSRLTSAAVLLAVTVGVAWLGWLVGVSRGERSATPTQSNGDRSGCRRDAGAQRLALSGGHVRGAVAEGSPPTSGSRSGRPPRGAPDLPLPLGPPPGRSAGS